MNYFECSIINGTGGSGSKVIVTCDAAFAGTTISCTKGTLIYTQTCPSTSPYQVIFEGLENGTWTISGTAGGQTWTSEVVVEDIEINLLYGFDWRRWLTEGRVTETFESLDDILEDEPTLRQLFLVHDSVDYLAGITVITEDVEKIFNTDLAAKWINLSDYALDKFYAVADIKTVMDIADKYGYGEWVIIDDTTTPPTWGPKGNVPVMTANTAPYGEVSASSVWGTGLEAYRVFDNDSTSVWASTANNVLAYIQYKFTNPINIRRVICRYKDGPNTASMQNGKYKLQGSNDGNTWTDIASDLNWYKATGLLDEKIGGNEYYLYIRVQAQINNNTHPNGTYSQFDTVQFYGRELKVSVPTMTSNTAPYGTASCKDYQPGTPAEAWKAFSGSNAKTNYWAPATADSWVQYEFTNKVEVKGVRLYLGILTTDLPLSAKVVAQASEDGNTWTDVSSEVTLSANTAYDVPFTECQQTTAKYVRIFNTVNRNVCVYIAQFYGKDYSEKEFEVGTTKKWLYDHGVELETVTQYRGAMEKESYRVKVGYDVNNSPTSSVGCQVNLAPYSLARMKAEDWYKDGNSNITLIIINNTSSYTTLGYTVLTEPYNTAVDISSINDVSLVCGQSDGGSSRLYFTELWLE